MTIKYPQRLCLLSSQSASSSASIVFTQISSNFTNYYLKIRKVLPATDGVNLYIQVSTDGGATYITTTTYNIITTATDSSGGNKSNRNISATEMYLCTLLSNVSTRPAYVDVIFYNLNSSTYMPRMLSKSIQASSIDLAQVTQSSSLNTTTTPITAFKVYCSSGNIASGQFYFYGCNEGGLLY